jgi:hypothetical protein
MKQLTVMLVAAALMFVVTNVQAANDADQHRSETAQEQQSSIQVEAVDCNERTIYHSPQTPGHTAWVALWQLPDGRLRCDFLQLTGPKEKPIATGPILESRDGAGTWTRLDVDTPAERVIGLRGMAVLPDGTLIRSVWPQVDFRSVPWPFLNVQESSGFVERSTDGGTTWGKEIYLLPIREYRIWPTTVRTLRDGRLVVIAGVWKRDSTQYVENGNPDARIVKMMFVSSDKGETWSQPIVIMPPNVGVCPESDFCELPNGDLFFVHRAEHYSPTDKKDVYKYNYSDRMQSIVSKQGTTFVPGKCEVCPFGHSGYPAVLYTQEKIILHLGQTGVHWTGDLGNTWRQVKNSPVTGYYPKALQLKDGTIVCVAHSGGDDEYGKFDKAIIQQTFRLKFLNAVRQP